MQGQFLQVAQKDVIITCLPYLIVDSKGRQYKVSNDQAVINQINKIESLKVLKMPPRLTISQDRITTSHQIAKEALLNLKFRTNNSDSESRVTKKTESKTSETGSKLFKFKKKRKVRKFTVIKPKNPNIIRLFE